MAKFSRILEPGGSDLLENMTVLRRIQRFFQLRGIPSYKIRREIVTVFPIGDPEEELLRVPYAFAAAAVAVVGQTSFVQLGNFTDQTPPNSLLRVKALQIRNLNAAVMSCFVILGDTRIAGGQNQVLDQRFPSPIQAAGGLVFAGSQVAALGGVAILRIDNIPANTDLFVPPEFVNRVVLTPGVNGTLEVAPTIVNQAIGATFTWTQEPYIT